jgi:hypothetical protein
MDGLFKDSGGRWRGMVFWDSQRFVKFPTTESFKENYSGCKDAGYAVFDFLL